MSKKIRQTELRLKNDLIELKRNKMTTNEFVTEVSDIIKDEVNELFKIHVYISKKFQSNDNNFIIIFNSDYPFKPPKIFLINRDKDKYSFVDNYGFIKLKFLQDDNWSPCVSLKVIIFALELVIYEPNDKYDYTSIELINNEVKYVSDYRFLNYSSLPTSSPKIITYNKEYIPEIKRSRKRKYEELNEYPYDTLIPLKKFKFLHLNEQSNMEIDN